MQKDATLSEQAFVALQARRGMVQADSKYRPVTFADILHYVLGSTDIDQERVAAAINTNLDHRRTYRQLLSQNRRAYSPVQAQAQDNELIDIRHGEGFKIKLRISRARVEQVYVVLEVEFPQLFIADKPVILHMLGEHSHQRLDFPPLSQGQSQFILDHQDPRLLALRDLDSELNLV